MSPSRCRRHARSRHGRRELEQPDNVFFLFEVEDVAKARAFITSPTAAEVGKASGVIDGEYHFLQSGQE